MFCIKFKIQGFVKYEICILMINKIFCVCVWGRGGWGWGGGGYWHLIILLRDYQIILDFVDSAYCGGMWLAALRMMIEMATILKKEDDVLHYKEILDKGKVSYQTKLWNGKFHHKGIIPKISYLKGKPHPPQWYHSKE